MISHDGSYYFISLVKLLSINYFFNFSFSKETPQHLKSLNQIKATNSQFIETIQLVKKDCVSILRNLLDTNL
ncbi:unnamed protein product [Paramecium pentaurelia]|uniref:Uncharacterized protein n=1 Tax=Paramecium pentaurelia TaxID=43138 RepID=A0A8S1XJY6_9CILI|nr:unnamed protein product [Paramecium pentaurelia]